MAASPADRTNLISCINPPELAVQGYQLEMTLGPEVGKIWELGATTRVGKGPDNDIVVVDATVSRHHFILERRPEGFLLRDVGSTNGTFLDNARVVEAYIKPGIEIRAGEVKFRLKPFNEGVNIAPSTNSSLGHLVGQSAIMRKIFALLERVATSDTTILFVGETGTGKGAVARAVHDLSQRAKGPFVTIDCGSISRSLIESELFGHEKGAFTGASQLRKGALETCKSGTLFIDELDDLPLDIQPKLLRALDEREITRVGSSKTIKLDLRVIAATKKDLRVEVAEGRFREDLFYRLSVITVPLPPLRERLEDIPLLAAHLYDDNEAWDRLPRAFKERLMAHSFPGNIRELRNLLERAAYGDDPNEIDPNIFPYELMENASTEFKLAVDFKKPFKDAKEMVIERFEREYLRRLLARTSNKMSRAAREAQIDRKYLYMLISKYRMTTDE